ncbi:MAG: alginate export family protein [Salinimicrobium sp.]
MKNIYLLLFFFVYSISFSQTFETSLQLRPRLEFRNGYKNLLFEDQDPATFISQRSRLTLGYKNEKLLVKLAAQNIHVWGDVPTMRLKDNNGIALFEAYGQYSFNEDFFVRLGRQVLSYDNQRILGEVNWAQQGQSHDAALLSWQPAENSRLDLGFAYNAPAETLAEVPYAVNSYQNLQFAWYHLEFGKSGLSLLAMNTGYEDPADQEVDYLQTFGGFYKFNSRKFAADASAYGQTGKRLDRDLSAFYAGANLNYAISGIWKVGAGAEYLSGTNMDENSGDLNSFTPLFGTNHAFNGFMDYFYVGNHQNTVGLVDLYGKVTYSAPKFELSVIPHAFSSAATIIDPSAGEMDKYLGTEVDLAGSWKVAKDFSVAMGYSQMFATDSLELLKGGDAGASQNWAWLMVNFNPTLFSFSK